MLTRKEEIIYMRGNKNTPTVHGALHQPSEVPSRTNSKVRQWNALPTHQQEGGKSSKHPTMSRTNVNLGKGESIHDCRGMPFLSITHYKKGGYYIILHSHLPRSTKNKYNTNGVAELMTYISRYHQARRKIRGERKNQAKGKGGKQCVSLQNHLNEVGQTRLLQATRGSDPSLS